jgi:Regulator of chromosome condensation (RCC1) repeat
MNTTSRIFPVPSLAVVVIIMLHISGVQAITLQIPNPPNAFPLLVEPYQTTGNVISWGLNDCGQTNTPADITNIVQVSCEYSGVIALQSNGKVITWAGRASNGKITNISPPFGLSDVVQVAGGRNYASFDAALLQNGTVVAWGYNGYGQTNIPIAFTNIVQIAPSYYGIYALNNQGTVLITSNAEATPYYPSGFPQIIEIAAGNAFALGLCADSTVVAWGNNSNGRGGYGGETNVPAGLTNVVQVAAGSFHAVALLSNGTVVCWGANGSGQCNVPQGLANVVQVAAGENFTDALLNDGTVVAWGDNTYGQTSIPAGLTNVFQISAGGYFSSALFQAASQTITPFTQIPNQTNGCSPINITLPTSSSGLPVNVTVLSGPATISGNIVTPTGFGTITLAANQPGVPGVNAAPQVTTSFQVSGISQSISSFGSIPTQTYGIPFTINLPTSSSGLPVSVSLSGPGTLSNNTITPTAAGTITLTANQAGNSTYAAAQQVTKTVTVQAASQTITPFTQIPNQTYGVSPLTITLPTSTSGLPVTTQATGPASLSGSKLTITGAGLVTLTATQTGNSGYAAASPVTTSFTVSQASQTINFTNIPNQIYGNKTVTLSAAASSGLPVSYSSSSTNISLISNVVTILGAGTASITASQSGNSNWVAATPVIQDLVINKAPQTISAFTPIQNTNYSNNETITILPPLASSDLPVEVTVKSGPATITNNTVSITGAGTIVLAADQAGDANYLAASEVTTSFIVSPANQTITPQLTNPLVYGVAPITLNSTDNQGQPLSYSVSGPASISNNVISFNGVGTVTLITSQTGNANYNPVSITNFFTVEYGQTIFPFSPVGTQIFGVKPVKIVLPQSSSGLPTTLSVLSGPATNNGNIVTILGAGAVVLAANQAGNGSFYAAPQVTTSFNVNPAKQTISFPPIGNQGYGIQPLSLGASSSSALPVSYLITGPAVITNGMLSFNGLGKVTVTAGQQGNQNFLAAAPVARSFSVIQGTQTITPFQKISAQTVSSPPFTISLPTSSSGLAVDVSISGPAVLEGNQITLTGEKGTVKLTATQGGNTYYKHAPPVTTSFAVK